MNRAAKIFRALLFPPKCVCCGERLPYDTTLPLCKSCADDWERETVEPCGFCQKPVSKCLCATPHMKSTGVSTLFKLAYYKAGKKTCPNRILFRMKESASAPLYSFVATRLSEKVLAYLQEKKISVSDCILTYAPRHRRAVFRTGMDQAERLSRELSRELEIKRLALLERERGRNKRGGQGEVLLCDEIPLGGGHLVERFLQKRPVADNQAVAGFYLKIELLGGFVARVCLGDRTSLGAFR